LDGANRCAAHRLNRLYCWSLSQKEKGSKMSLNSTEEVRENTNSVASLRPAFTIAGTGVHLPPEQAFTITGIRTVLRASADINRSII
jgi:hypothetical protein